jgi:hypothetical protein
MPLRVTAVFSEARRFSEVEVATDLATARILQCSKPCGRRYVTPMPVPRAERLACVMRIDALRRGF